MAEADLDLSHYNSDSYRRLPWRESLAAVVILIAAWVYGFFSSKSPVAPLVPNVLPEASVVKAEGELFVGYDAAGKVVGYAAAADATGYGGPIYLLVGVDPAGEIQGIQIIEHRENPGFFVLLKDRAFFQQFLGKTTDQPLILGQNIDGVTGASVSSGAVTLAIQRSIQKIQGGTARAAIPLKFGLPEIALLALAAVSITQLRIRNVRWRKILKWVSLVSAMVVLGFVLNKSLTLANIASLLVGYWPTWQDHLYWYILVVGMLGYTLIAGRNIYCSMICPFGAVQECLGTLGASKPFLPVKPYKRLKWVPRWLAVLALALGLAFRQPGVISYEPFGTLFSFAAGFFPWMLLVFVLFGSMIILRPFCYYLCPVGAVMNFLLLVNNQVKKLWKNKRAHRQETPPASS
jgi:NosR/NirI family transcriptional regulator, nitrous oxide reductase regulator